MATSQAREQLLAAVVEQALRGGIADLSLRELAAAIGTSHRMLLYHFGSRQGLLTAVVRTVEEAQRANVSGLGITAASARPLWQHFSDPQLWPAERLFFELYAHALLGRPGTEGFLDSAIEPWIAVLVPAIMQEAGLDASTARAEARLVLAVTRGLLLDLLATGDRDGVTEAFERQLQYTDPVYAKPPVPPGPPRPAAMTGSGGTGAVSDAADRVGLRVADVDGAAQFYEGLGFHRVGQVPGPDGLPVMAILRRGGLQLLVDALEGMPFPDSPRERQTRQGPRGLGVVIGIETDDVDSAARYCAEAGCEVVTGPRDAPWGERYAECIDPYGYAWKFFQPLPNQPADSLAAAHDSWFS